MAKSIRDLPYGPIESATPEIQAIADKVKTDAETFAGEKFTMYKALKYRRAPFAEPGKTPMLLGVEYYLILVQTGDKQFFELSVEVIVDRTGTTKLLGISSKDSPDSPLHPIYVIDGGLLK